MTTPGTSEAPHVRVACFGEVLLRLAAPSYELLSQAKSLELTVAGAEANVAVSLSTFGHRVAMLTVLPDNTLGSSCAAELRRYGVDVSAVRIGPGRMGLYFLERGAGHRPARVVYDREGSAFALALADEKGLQDAVPQTEWLHISGVTAALGPATARAVIALARAAHRRGIRVSFDCNYRASLWERWRGDAGAVFRQISEWCELLFAGSGDFTRMFGGASAPGGADAIDAFASGALTALSRFERLRFVATTVHDRCGAEDLTLSGLMMSRDGLCTTRTYSLRHVVERIGNGDAFAAGVLHAVVSGRDAQRALDFGTAAACLKHSISGDANLATTGDIEALMRGESAVRR